METIRPLHPWVAERRDRITFAIQTTDERENPRGPALLEAAPIVEELGFDAIFLVSLFSESVTLSVQ